MIINAYKNKWRIDSFIYCIQIYSFIIQCNSIYHIMEHTPIYRYRLQTRATIQVVISECPTPSSVIHNPNSSKNERNSLFCGSITCAKVAGYDLVGCPTVSCLERHKISQQTDQNNTSAV